MQYSFYKRPLPSNLIAFASTEGKELFKETLNEGNLESYFTLIQQFDTQNDPAFCALSSLTIVLNTLEVDPKRQWKGVWRWYSDEMLDCCRSLEQVRETGVTLPEFSCLAKCNGLDEQTNRADLTTKDKFWDDLIKVSQSSDTLMVVAYHRKTLGQTGSGHYSPVAGVNQKKKMVLILDVARFKYPVYWVPFELLWDSLNPIDSETGKPRGYILLKKTQQFTEGLVRLALNKNSWLKLSKTLRLLDVSTCQTSKDLVCLIVKGIPIEYSSLVEMKITPTIIENSDSDEEFCAESSKRLNEENKHRQIEELVSAVKTLPIYQIVESVLPSSSIDSTCEKTNSLHPRLYVPPNSCSQYIAFLSLFLLAWVQTTRKTCSASVPSMPEHLVTELVDSVSQSTLVLHEIEVISKQIQSLNSCCDEERVKRCCCKHSS
ncbi:hypothetical protein K7432_002545 [Basidiobolus ranarum]|uniref:glutathione gamma-glutamylcysteinyltransferase n=1 Tax=Basidiobolus ranarum TaxID=34480 RepID=A0ABR2X1E8_9FUNG